MRTLLKKDEFIVGIDVENHRIYLFMTKEPGLTVTRKVEVDLIETEIVIARLLKYRSTRFGIKEDGF